MTLYDLDPFTQRPRVSGGKLIGLLAPSLVSGVIVLDPWFGLGKAAALSVLSTLSIAALIRFKLSKRARLIGFTLGQLALIGVAFVTSNALAGPGPLGDTHGLTGALVLREVSGYVAQLLFVLLPNLSGIAIYSDGLDEDIRSARALLPFSIATGVSPVITALVAISSPLGALIACSSVMFDARDVVWALAALGVSLGCFLLWSRYRE
jgi:hypothetical protein